jgi:hypothetical protein
MKTISDNTIDQIAHCVALQDKQDEFFLTCYTAAMIDCWGPDWKTICREQVENGIDALKPVETEMLRIWTQAGGQIKTYNRYKRACRQVVFFSEEGKPFPFKLGAQSLKMWQIEEIIKQAKVYSTNDGLDWESAINKAMYDYPKSNAERKDKRFRKCTRLPLWGLRKKQSPQEYRREMIRLLHEHLMQCPSGADAEGIALAKIHNTCQALVGKKAV